MSDYPQATIPTKQELHQLAFELATASLQNAFPGKTPDHLYPAALSIAVKISTSIDNLLGGVRKRLMEIN